MEIEQQASDLDQAWSNFDPLLNNLLVLEYVNAENWPDINPLLRDILEQ